MPLHYFNVKDGSDENKKPHQTPSCIHKNQSAGLKSLHQAYNCIFVAQRQIPPSVFCQVMEHYFDELAGDIDSINSGWSLRRSTLRSKLTRARLSMWEQARRNSLRI